MNKKVFLIPLAIGLAIWIIFELISTAETGNHFVMTVPELSQDASFKSVKHVTVYLDNSGSMKGYVDFAGVNNQCIPYSCSMHQTCLFLIVQCLILTLLV